MNIERLLMIMIIILLIFDLITFHTSLIPHAYFLQEQNNLTTQIQYTMVTPHLVNPNNLKPEVQELEIIIIDENRF